MSDQPLHIHITELYDGYSKNRPCSQCSWGHDSEPTVTIEQLERLLDEKINAHQAWGKARIFATEVNGVENRAERVRRDILEAEAYQIHHAAERTYDDAIGAYVDQKKRGG